MKKAILLLVTMVCAWTSVQPVQADEVITHDLQKIPAAARAFLQQHFPQAQMAYIKIDTDFLSKKFEVVLSDRTAIEFNSKGEWEELKSKHRPLPESVIPPFILEYVKAQYPGAKCRKLERDRGETEADLDNGLSLTFNKQGQLIDIDD